MTKSLASGPLRRLAPAIFAAFAALPLLMPAPAQASGRAGRVCISRAAVLCAKAIFPPAPFRSPCVSWAARIFRTRDSLRSPPVLWSAYIPCAKAIHWPARVRPARICFSTLSLLGAARDGHRRRTTVQRQKLRSRGKGRSADPCQSCNLRVPTIGMLDQVVERISAHHRPPRARQDPADKSAEGERSAPKSEVAVCRLPVHRRPGRFGLACLVIQSLHHVLDRNS